MNVNVCMKKNLFCALALTFLLAACVPSVNPFYTDKDVVTDVRLIGTWQEDDDKESPAVWKFEAQTNNACAVTLTEDKGRTGHFEGHLFKLSNEMFLDLTPTECSYATNQASIVNISMIPGHLLVRVQLAKDKLNLAFCNPDYVKQLLEKNPKALAHRVVDSSVILTAETSALQKFMLAHLGEGELFGKGGDYKKLPDSAN